MKNQEPIFIIPWNQVVTDHAFIADLDSIFFDASSTQAFADAAARSAFRERWLGSYLTLNPDEAFLARTQSGSVIGYLVGALQDPAGDPRYYDLGYIRQFAPLTRLYPAHLHINLAVQHRSRGIGALLVGAFLDHAKARGAAGVHVVTGKGMRNVAFYERNGFAPLAEAAWNGRDVLLMGRGLA